MLQLPHSALSNRVLGFIFVFVFVFVFDDIDDIGDDIGDDVGDENGDSRGSTAVVMLLPCDQCLIGAGCDQSPRRTFWSNLML